MNNFEKDYKNLTGKEELDENMIIIKREKKNMSFIHEERSDKKKDCNGVSVVENHIKNGVSSNCLNSCKLIRALDLKKLIILNLSNCGLHCVPDLSKLVNLKTLNLSHNSLSKLPNSCKYLNRLHNLNLAHNCFFEVPGCISEGLTFLMSLDFSHNKLNEFNVGTRALQVLKKLNLSYNNLNRIPDWLINIYSCSLQELDISGNDNLFEGPLSDEVIFDLKLKKNAVSNTLRVLKLKNCLMSVSKLNFLSTFLKLDVLDLSNSSMKGKSQNVLWNIPIDHLPNVKNMRELYLSDVCLFDISKDVMNFVNLKILDLSCNDLTSLPDEICELEELEHLDVSKNYLINIPDKFGNLVSLKKLFLSSNKLAELPKSFINLKNLELLDLYENYFFEMPEFIFGMNLKELDLAYNYFDPVLFSKDKFIMCDNGNVCNKYEKMRENFLTNSYKCAYNRYNIPRRDPDEDADNSEDEDDSHHNHFSSFSDFSSDEEDNDFHSINVSVQDKIKTENSGETKVLPKVEEAEEEEENWDKDCDSDESWDPNFASSESYRSYTTPTFFVSGHNNKYLNGLEKNSFCPGDNHPQSIRAKKPYRVFEVPNEGQFDDI